jgi:ubiquinone/menaquinone biosynthesis C-methylase UbiE
MAFESLKERQSVMWGNGPYDRVAESLTDIHELVIERMQPRAGERWLDIASGSGRVSELLAQRGADVVGVDLSPALVETAKERAAAQGLTIDYRVGDCERLDGIDDASFDGATSVVGLMFAPDHEATAAQLARVVKPGGRVAVASWTSRGGIGDLFRLMGPFQPAPPPSSPFDWGDETRVQELLGDAFELEFELHDSPHRFESGAWHWELFATSYGPTKTLAENLEDERRVELRETWVTHYEALREGGEIVQSREYLLVTGRRR